MPQEASTALLDLTEANQTDHPDVYILAVPVADCFRDDNYQRDIDLRRAKSMTEDWNPRLIGVIDVSDRGPDYTQNDVPARFAIINGQHRWKAASLRDPASVLVARVHEGLSLADEARLFYEIDSSTRRLTGWDRWKARRGAQDPQVMLVENIAADAGFRIGPEPYEGTIRCVSTCEKIVKLGGRELLADTLDVIRETWGHRLDAVDAPLVHGIAIALHTYPKEISRERLIDTLVDFVPRQLKARAQAEREYRSGTLGKLSAIVIVGIYNNSRGPRLPHRTL